MANIIITGTSRGIGFELVKLFAQEGHEVLALSRNTKPVESLGLSNVRAFPFDLGNPSDYKKVNDFLEQWHVVDVLINNAGTGVRKSIDELSIEDFLTVYNTNVFGLALLTKEIIPFMKKNK